MCDHCNIFVNIKKSIIMLRIFYLTFFLFIVCFLNNSCGNQKANLKLPSAKPLSIKDSLRSKADSLLKYSKPVLGYRFIVTGNFDGDHLKDTLIERYTDSAFQNEAPKYYESPDTNFDYGDVVFLNQYLGKRSFLLFKKNNIKLEGGQLGFHYIENCGDLNLDGKDELLLVRQWPDWSNLNHVLVYTFKNSQWEEIFTTPVWEWQFPPTPSISMIPGLFGDYEYGSTQSDTVDKLLEKDLKAFKFFTYYPDHSVEFDGRNPVYYGEDPQSEKEYDSIGPDEYMKKHFKKVYLHDSLYMKDLKNPSIYYKAKEYTTKEDGNIILFSFDDPAEMMTTRIFINNSRSPFRNK
jgi:hypothetical protein